MARRVTCAALLLFVVFVTPVGCGRPEAAIGVLLPLSGELAPWGSQARLAIELALETGPEGSRPRLLVRDTRGDATEAARLFEELCDEGATVVLGPLTTDNALAVGLVARARGVPLVVPGATGTGVTGGNSFVFRICYTDAEAARALASFARRDLQLGNVIVAVDLTQSYSVGLAEAFSREFRMLQGLVLDEHAYFGGDDPEGLAGVLAWAARREADGVFIPGYAKHVERMVEGTDDAVLADLVLLGADGWDQPGLQTLLVDRVAGAYYTTHFSLDEQRPGGAAFVDAFRERAGADPTGFAALAYDAARAVEQVFDAAIEAATVRDRIGRLRRFEGVTGRVTLGPDGSPASKGIVLEQLHDSRRSRFIRRLDG